MQCINLLNKKTSKNFKKGLTFEGTYVIISTSKGNKKGNKTWVIKKWVDLQTTQKPALIN